LATVGRAKQQQCSHYKALKSWHAVTGLQCDFNILQDFTVVRDYLCVIVKQVLPSFHVNHILFSSGVWSPKCYYAKIIRNKNKQNCFVHIVLYCKSNYVFMQHFTFRCDTVFYFHTLGIYTEFFYFNSNIVVLDSVKNTYLQYALIQILVSKDTIFHSSLELYLTDFVQTQRQQFTTVMAIK